jgi:hypothetical protein
VQSAQTGRAARLDDVLERAYLQAVGDEVRADVRGALESWSSVREALAMATSPASGPDSPRRPKDQAPAAGRAPAGGAGQVEMR